MAFFKKLKDRLFKTSSKIGDGLDAIVEDGGSVAPAELPSEPDVVHQLDPAAQEPAGSPQPRNEAPDHPAAEPQPSPALAPPEPASAVAAPEPVAASSTPAEVAARVSEPPVQRVETPAPPAEQAKAVPAPPLEPSEPSPTRPVERAEAVQAPAPLVAEASPPAAVTSPKPADAAASVPPEEEPQRRGLLGRLLGRRSDAPVLRRTLDDDMLEQLEELLITADMGVDTALRVSANLADSHFGKKLSTDEIKALLAAEIARIMDPVARPLPLYPSRPQVVLVVGVN
ncbi:MAG: signal recognition particle receptor subunit alpha, partial [Pseudomonadota bacterium]